MKPQISMEFFPPKTPEGVEKLRHVRQQLRVLDPQYFSVTYGAGGTTQKGTYDTICEIQNEGVEAVPHLSCVASTRQGITQLLKQYQEKGIKHIVTLRGDLPSGYGLGGEFRYAAELVSFIREQTGDWFHIEVAAYPEVHPQAQSMEHDLRNFAAKIKAGANSAITQYFYNADAYFHFVEQAQKHGVNVPIVPGIMPITNSTQLQRFSEMCGAEIPRWMRLKLSGFGDDSAGIKAFGVEMVSRLCEKLIAGGAPSLHFYSLNQAQAILKIWQNL